MSGLADRDWREILAFAYFDAVDTGDAEALAELWERAETNPEVENFLRELAKGLLELEGPGGEFEQDAGLVKTIALKNLPEFESNTAPIGTITAAEVAWRIQADATLGRRLDAADRLANAGLLAREEPLPEPIRMSVLIDWGRSLGVDAGPRYWSAFHEVAVMLRMARGQQEGYLAAARRADPRGGEPGGKS